MSIVTDALSLPENWPALANSGLSPLVYVVAALALALSLALALDLLDLIPRPLLSTWAALRVYAETLVLGIFALKLFVGAITRGAYSDAFALAVLIAFARRGLAPRAAPAKAPAPAPAAATPARPARASTSPGRGSSPVDPSKLSDPVLRSKLRSRLGQDVKLPKSKRALVKLYEEAFA